MIMVHDGTAADDEAGHGNSEPAIRKRVTLAVSAARWSLKSRATSPLVASEPRADDEWRADAALAFFSTITPFGHIGSPEEMASAILFLASDDGSYGTGIDLVGDGGITRV